MTGFGVLELLGVTIQLFVGFNSFQNAKAEKSLLNKSAVQDPEAQSPSQLSALAWSCPTNTDTPKLPPDSSLNFFNTHCRERSLHGKFHMSAWLNHDFEDLSEYGSP